MTANLHSIARSPRGVALHAYPMTTAVRIPFAWITRANPAVTHLYAMRTTRDIRIAPRKESRPFPALRAKAVLTEVVKYATKMTFVATKVETDIRNA